MSSETRNPSPMEEDSNSTTDDDESRSFTCSICFEIMENPRVTKCGHTYCYECIVKSIEEFKKCPQCFFYLTENDIFPNFGVTSLVEKYKARTKRANSAITLKNLENFMSTNSTDFNLREVHNMIDVLKQRKDLLEIQHGNEANTLVSEFLKRILKCKEEKVKQYDNEYKQIKKDLLSIRTALTPVGYQCPEMESDDLNVINSNFSLVSLEQYNQIFMNLDNITDCYIETRLSKRNSGDNNSESSDSGLSVFREDLVKFSRFKSMRPIARVEHERTDSKTIVSSIEFDHTNELFAVAGIMKKIKIYNYNTVLQLGFEEQQPHLVMNSSSKISCLSWNSFHKTYLASSDYEGSVIIWDAATKKKIIKFREHEERCWSVNFNLIDTRYLASASDDRSVKLWSIDSNRSVASIEIDANVCAVQFNPQSSCHLAFGASDHRMYYYDVRNINEALCVYEGHEKAVSYVKFLNDKEIVTASTDSQLKMWNVHESSCLRTLSGHINEKNFIGLDTDGDYVACGSENNSLYIYYKKMKKPLFSREFEAVYCNLTKEVEIIDVDDDAFVSAVGWRPKSNMCIAANSQGVMNVYELL